MGRAGAKHQTFHGYRRCFFASLERPSVVHRLKQILGRLPPAGLPGWIYHKEHKGPQRTQRGKPSTARDTKEGDAGASRACAQGARPARGPVGHGGLRTPCFGFGSLSVEPRRINLPREAIRHFVAPQGRSVAVEGLRLRRCTLRSPWPWKVCPSGCTLCSLGRVSAPCPICPTAPPLVVFQENKRNARDGHGSEARRAER